MGAVLSGEFRRKVTLMEEKMMADDRSLNGRLAWVFFQNYKRNEVEIGMTDFRDLQNVRIKGDALVAFMTGWDSCLYGMLK